MITRALNDNTRNMSIRAIKARARSATGATNTRFRVLVRALSGLNLIIDIRRITGGLFYLLTVVSIGPTFNFLSCFLRRVVVLRG